MSIDDTDLPTDTEPNHCDPAVAGSGMEALFAEAMALAHANGAAPADGDSTLDMLRRFFVEVPDPKMPVLVLPADMRFETVMVIDSIAEERRRQDRLWGGPHHDDRHDRETWMSLIYDNLAKAGRSIKDEDLFEHLRSAAALCCATIESITRVTGEIDREVADHVAALETSGCQPPQRGE